MTMNDKSKDASQWYREGIKRRNWRANMIPNLSRPTSRKSGIIQSGIQETDWVSLSGSSVSSSSNIFENPKVPYFGKRRQSRANIEEILSKHQVIRPRSVSLVKYDPLPAIISGTPSGTPSSNSPPTASVSRMDDLREYDDLPFGGSGKQREEATQISPIDEQVSEVAHDLEESPFEPREFMLCEMISGEESILDLNEDEDSREESILDLNEDEDSREEAPSSLEETKLELSSNLEDETASGNYAPRKNGHPHKLVRSRTFEVIETTLTNLPIIEDQPTRSHDSLDAPSTEILDLSGEGEPILYSRKPNFDVCVSVNGLALSTFLSQGVLEGKEGSPRSSVSLVTHPSSPDSGFAVESSLSDKDADFESPPDNESDISDGAEGLNCPLDGGSPLEASIILVKLPNEQNIDLKLDRDVTLREFLRALENLELEEKRIRVVDRVDAKLLAEPLRKFSFKGDTQVCLVPWS